MTLTPLLTAAPVIQFHVVCALTALILGPFALYGRKSRSHKIVGYVWVTAMVGLAVSSFFIHSFPVLGPFSPIHLLSLFALWSIFEAMRHVFAGRIALHRLVMRNLYWYGLIVAGLFNFLPDRTINRTLFPGTPEAGWVVMGLGGAIALVFILRGRNTRLAAA